MVYSKIILNSLYLSSTVGVLLNVGKNDFFVTDIHIWENTNILTVICKFSKKTI